jgi:regulator of sigma E protease
MNLLPLPVLDGGQVVITLGEAIVGKKLNDKVKIALMAVCWALLISLMLFVTWNDISRLIGK